MKKALVVGINSYPGNGALTGCVTDAERVTNVLEVQGDGSPNFDVLLKTDVSTKSELKGLISELFSGDNDIAFFYFSGHGSVDACGGYIATPDATQHDVGVSMDEILILANESKAKNRIIILDCCFSGNMGSPSVAGSKATQITEGVTILTASRKDEPSLEIQGFGGVFTNLLVEALRGGAADLRGHITPGGIYAYIDQALGPWDQRPIFKTNVTRFTSLREIQPQVSLETLRRIVELFPKPQQEFQLDPSFEYTNDPNELHEVAEPYAKAENVEKFKQLQKLQSVGLVVPVDETHMYYAAMHSKTCKLTALGYHYWQLVRDKRI